MWYGLIKLCYIHKQFYGCRNPKKLLFLREHDLNGSESSDRSTQGTASAGLSDLSDMSDFCLQPTEDMDEEEQRALQEEQDAVSL